MFSLLALSSLSLFAVEELQDTCNYAPAPRRASLRHIESKGIGYRQGYTSVDLFVASNQPMHSLVPFVDARLHIFNNGLPALNAGMGLRYITPSWVYGINTYYDYRKTHRFHYNQFALGFEALGKVWDIRLNGYLPVGKKKSPFFNTKFSHFAEHYAFLSSKQEFAMRGLNLEAGYHFKKLKHADFYAAAGPYYFYNEGKNAIGGEARVSATIYNHLKLEVNGSYDPIFHGIGQGQLSIIFPFGPKNKVVPRKNQPCANQLILRERALQPVDRSEIIILDRKRHTTKAINPDTGSPYTFYFVNNLSHSDGTYESPYTTLAQAADGTHPGDIIYVYPGNGSAYNTTATGFTLQNNQKLWGSGTLQNLNTTLGIVGIANQTGGMPLLQGGAAELGIVTLANNNEVSGMHINGSGTAGYGILGGNGTQFPVDTTLSVANALIQNNLLDGTYARSAVRVVGKEAAIIYHNTISARVGNSYSGIEVFNLPGQNLTSAISYNTVTATATNNAYGIYADNHADASSSGLSGATITSSISYNTVSATATDCFSRGIYAHNHADASGSGSVVGTITSSISYNTVSATATCCSRGIYALNSADASSSGSGGTITSSISYNTVSVIATCCNAYGIYAHNLADASSSGSGGTITSSISYNTVSATATNCNAYGIYASSQASPSGSGGTITSSISYNTVSATATTCIAYGIYYGLGLPASNVTGGIDHNTGTVTGAAGSKTICTACAPGIVVETNNSIELISN